MFNKIKKLLDTPYPFNYELKSILVHSAGIGTFIFLFLLTFQPFDSSSYSDEFINKVLVYLGYGLISFIFPLLFYLLIPRLFPRIIMEEKIKIKYEFLLSLGLLVTIGLGNALYHHILHPHHNLLFVILEFQFFTFAVGILPTTLMLLIDIIVNMNKNLRNARAMNEQLSKTMVVNNPEQIIQLVAEPGKETLSIPADQLLFIKAAGNYVEIYHVKHDNVNMDILRCTIKGLQSQLADHPYFFRCHRTYLVNLHQIRSVDGDSQGYQIRMDHTSENIPVSRSYLKSFKKALMNT